jgi:hypothetical protein
MSVPPGSTGGGCLTTAWRHQRQAGTLRAAERLYTGGVRTLVDPHVTPADVIEYLLVASEEIKQDIVEPQAAPRPPRWVALEAGELVLEEA